MNWQKNLSVTLWVQSVAMVISVTGGIIEGVPPAYKTEKIKKKLI